MNQVAVLLLAGLGIVATTPQATWAQAPDTAPNSSAGHTQAIVPRLVQFAGTLKDASAKPVAGLQSVTFAIYEEQDGGTALWSETQNVSADATGHYAALLGATTSGGVPVELFGTQQSRWLGVSIAGQPEMPRVLLANVPYALKAVDAESLGGIPASAFVRVNPSVGETATGNTQPNSATAPSTTSASAPSSTPTSSSTAAPAAAAPTVTGSGTKGLIPLWTSSTTLGNSVLVQNSAGNIGIGTLTPTQKFEVHLGNALVRGPQGFGATGATAFLYVGDTNHPIEAIYNTGLAIGAYLAPQALFIQDRTGDVGIGTAAPASPFDVRGTSNNQIVTVTQTGSGNGITASTTAPTAAAVEGLVTDSSCSTVPCSAGVLGETTSHFNGTGVMGIAAGRSVIGSGLNNGAAVWGDTSGLLGVSAILGTADNNSAVEGINNSDFPTIISFNQSPDPGAEVFYASGPGNMGYCATDNGGNLHCTGSKSAVVPLESGRKVSLYAVEAPENWFEDFGASELRGGSAVVSLDPMFLQTINAGAGYHVFLTPKGDCRGLYVSNQTLTSFEVHELGGGTSSIAFDYRIAARRKGYENIRMADVTEHMNQLQRSLPKLKPGLPAQSKAVASVKQ